MLNRLELGNDDVFCGYIRRLMKCAKKKKIHKRNDIYYLLASNDYNRKRFRLHQEKKLIPIEFDT